VKNIYESFTHKMAAKAAGIEITSLPPYGTVLGWPFPTIKYKCDFLRKYTEAILSNCTRKLLWFEITKMLTAA